MVGSIDPDNTTTTGDSEPVINIKLFHIIKAENTMVPKLSACFNASLHFHAFNFVYADSIGSII